MYLLGTILIISGIAAALLASVSYALVPRGNVAALAYGRFGTRAALGAVLLVVALIVYLFLMRRYDIKYVYDYSSADLELRFRIAAMWAGQPGSFVLWALWGLLAAQLLIRRTRHAEPYVLSVFMLLQAALLVFMLIRNPFVPYTDPTTGAAMFPPDGKGLNELLHNPWMVIHPPILFTGYALLAVPFAFALAGLWRRDYDGWARQALPWTLAGWSFLGLALLLGGYWAYETLGWGGYWGWDPVENSALVPWLTATALLHALLVQRTSGGFRRASFALAILTYLLVFYATFLTRTGVLSSFSVHSFVEEGLKWIMTGFLAALAIFSLAFLVWRWRDIPSRPISEKLLSRDSFFVLMILGLLVIATVVALGTSMPVISSIPGVGQALQNVFGAAFEIDRGNALNPQAPVFTDGRFGLVGSFYAATVPPLALILLALLIIGPLLGWHDTNMRHLLRALRWPALAAVVITCIALVAWRARRAAAGLYRAGRVRGRHEYPDDRALAQERLAADRRLPGASRPGGAADRRGRLELLRLARPEDRGAAGPDGHCLRLRLQLQRLEADPDRQGRARSDRQARRRDLQRRADAVLQPAHGRDHGRAVDQNRILPRPVYLAARVRAAERPQYRAAGGQWQAGDWAVHDHLPGLRRLPSRTPPAAAISAPSCA